MIGDGAEGKNSWILMPSTNLVQFLAEEIKLAGLTERAIFTLTKVPTLLAAAAKQIPGSQMKVHKNLQQLTQMARENSKFAEGEIANEFQRTRSHHAVAAWAAVETAIENLFVNLIVRVPDAEMRIRNHSDKAKIKSERVNSTVYDAKITIQSWERSLDNSETMARQLNMLSAFDINVDLTEQVSRTLSEMGALRDVILHNGGVIDERFQTRCPWLHHTVGEHIVINADVLGRYFDAASEFATQLLRAVLKSQYVRELHA